MSPSPHNIPTQTTFTLCRFQDVALGLEWLVLCQKYGLRDLGWYVSYDLGNQVGAEEGGGGRWACVFTCIFLFLVHPLSMHCGPRSSAGDLEAVPSFRREHTVL